MRTIFHKYNSITELGNDARRGLYSLRSFNNPQWVGGLNKEEAIKAAIECRANSSDMAYAQSIIDKIDSSVHDRERMEWAPNVMGAYPMVPDYLMGIPESMRMREPREFELAPIKIVMEVAVSGGLSHSEILRRGCAVAALAMRLSEERAVELHCCYGGNTKGDNYVWMAKLDCSPISLNQCVSIFASASFARMVAFNAMSAYSRNAETRIEWALGRPGRDRDIAMRKLMGLEPQDLFLQGGYLPDASVMQNDPVQWVHNQLEAQRHIAE